MNRWFSFVALALLAFIGCKPAANSTSAGGGDVVVENGGDVKPPKVDNDQPITKVDLPDNPARDLSAEQKKVDAMDVAALIAALGDDKLYDVAAEELKTRGAEAVDPLIAALDSDDPEKLQTAIFALGRLENEAAAALPKLKQIAANDDLQEEVTDSAQFAIDAIEGK